MVGKPSREIQSPVAYLFLHLKAAIGLLPLRDSEFLVQLGIEVFREKFLFDFLRDLRLLQIALRGGDGGLLIEGLAPKSDLEVRVVRFSLFSLR